MAVKVCATASIVSRASIVWSQKMLQLLPESETRLLEGASRILKAGSFTADATLDAILIHIRTYKDGQHCGQGPLEQAGGFKIAQEALILFTWVEKMFR